MRHNTIRKILKAIPLVFLAIAMISLTNANAAQAANTSYVYEVSKNCYF